MEEEGKEKHRNGKWKKETDNLLFPIHDAARFSWRSPFLSLFNIVAH